ncbi:hypothetical protein NQ317_001582 [Molorchus minor]|uniref:glycerol kinase n=1 Tax=Molorchus minor TaxID=1323400 RepID=A0ABQ9J934_9CUCU|nr:hypothetical protein NQ317_001582 [Molorchus minor]
MGPLVGAIDAGTSSARFILFKAGTTEIVASHQQELSQIYPQEGWVEQDPMEILNVVRDCIENTIDKLITKGGSVNDIVAVGITNQRESTIVWDKTTGGPLYNSIVWLDVRTSSTVDQLLDEVPNQTRNKNYLKPLCGLPLSPYFSAVKLKWLYENIPKVKKAMIAGNCLFGTVDSWLIWNLTGAQNGGLHITDVTNASRTMLMNIDTLKWDPGIPLSGCLGDQQSALVGQQCLNRGQSSEEDVQSDLLPEPPHLHGSGQVVKENVFQRVLISLRNHGHSISMYIFEKLGPYINFEDSAPHSDFCGMKNMLMELPKAKVTYGTGCFLLYNTSNIKVHSPKGLLTTVAYKLGPKTPPVYALEGSVAIAGAALNWLRDNLEIISSFGEAQSVAENAKHKQGGEVYFVPAFSGLYAPYWQQEARGVIVGISEETENCHIVKATLDAVCFQTRDILEAMHQDGGSPLVNLQLQADLAGVTVMKPSMAESTALGAAMVAGAAVGHWDLDGPPMSIPSTKWQPKISEDERDVSYSRWKLAIDRSMGWSI